jgi:hypothetical protein
MPSRALLIALALLALAACGGERSGEDVARDWVAALNDRDWERACELRHDRADDCEDDTRRSFDGGKVKLRPARSYLSGSETNDNKTTFAFDAAGASANVGFFRIVDDRVELEIVIIE